MFGNYNISHAKCLQPTGSNIHRSQPQSRQMPTSVSGYSLCATQGDSIDEENEATNNNSYVQDQLMAFTNAARQHQLNQSHVVRNATPGGPPTNSRAAGLAMSASNYSMSSGINLSNIL